MEKITKYTPVQVHAFVKTSLQNKEMSHVQ